MAHLTTTLQYAALYFCSICGNTGELHLKTKRDLFFRFFVFFLDDNDLSVTCIVCMVF